MLSVGNLVRGVNLRRELVSDEFSPQRERKIMNDLNGTLDRLEERLVRLESENRILRRRSRLILSGVAALGLMVPLIAAVQDQKDGTFRELTVERLVVRDAKGNVRVGIGHNDQGDYLQSFLDADGKERIQLGTKVDGSAHVSALDKNGTQRIAFGTSHDGQAMHNLFDAEGRLRLMSITDSKRGAAQLVLDNQGVTRITTVSEDKGLAYQRFSDADGKRRVETFTSTDGAAVHLLLDGDGNSRILSKVTTDNLASHAVSDNHGMPRIISNSSPDGLSGQMFYDPKGTLQVLTVTKPDKPAYHDVLGADKPAEAAPAAENPNAGPRRLLGVVGETDVLPIRGNDGPAGYPGLRITSVVPGSPAAAAGLVPGHMIASVNGTRIMDMEQLRKAVSNSGPVISLHIYGANGSSSTVRANLGSDR